MRLFKPYYVREGRKSYLETCLSEEEAQWILKRFTEGYHPNGFSWEDTGMEISEENVAVLYVEFSYYKDDFTSDFMGVSFKFPEGKWERITPSYWKDSDGYHVERHILSYPEN